MIKHLSVDSLEKYENADRDEIILFYYIKTNEIPDKLSREKTISSHGRITNYLHTRKVTIAAVT